MRVLDTAVDAGEEGGEALLLLGDIAAGRGETFAGLGRGIAQPADFGPGRRCRFDQAVGATLSFADRGSDAFPDFDVEPLDALAQRRRAFGQRIDRTILAARLRRERVQLCPRSGKRFEEVVGALVAVGGKLGEALVNQREAAPDLRNHRLRRSVLLGNPARQRCKGAVGMVDVRRERFCCVHTCLANAC